MDRTSVEELIARRYAEEYQATLRFEYPGFQAQKCCGETKAALGYRRADAGGLFLEAYLEGPIESVLQDVLGRNFARRDIVEIGNLASCNVPAMVALWARTANDLGSDAEIAVAGLTAPLRAMFYRLGIPLTEIAPADLIGNASGDEHCQAPYIHLNLDQSLQRFRERKAAPRFLIFQSTKATMQLREVDGTSGQDSAFRAYSAGTGF
jgi:Thermostable hemolysin